MATTTTVRIRCGGHLHRVSVTGRGAIALHDHNLRAERTLVALGAKLPRCLQVFDAWRRGDRSALPPALRPAFAAAVQRRSERFARRRARHWRVDPLTLPFASRIRARTVREAEKALHRCSYRRSQSSWAGGEHWVRAQVGAPDISGHAERACSKNGRWTGSNSVITARVPQTWLIRVWRRGLAVVDGVLVLDVLGRDEKGYYVVLAGRQGRGFDVYPCRARVITTPAGGHRLRWLKEG